MGGTSGLISRCASFFVQIESKKAMYTISKEFHFSSSHQLNDLPEGHQCGRLHGHNYVLRVFLQSPELNDKGFVQDYGELKSIKKFVDEVLDHRHLNDVFPLHNTTVENMSKIIYDMFKAEYPLLLAVEMSETPKTLCRYQP